MYVNIHTYDIHMCICTHIHVYAHTCVYLNTCTYIYVYIMYIIYTWNLDIHYLLWNLLNYIWK